MRRLHEVAHQLQANSPGLKLLHHYIATTCVYSRRNSPIACDAKIAVSTDLEVGVGVVEWLELAVERLVVGVERVLAARAPPDDLHRHLDVI